MVNYWIAFSAHFFLAMVFFFYRGIKDAELSDNGFLAVTYWLGFWACKAIYLVGLYNLFVKVVS